jgi:hyperosmotically inducible protein
VQLTGFVKNQAQIDKAAAIAGAAEGAKTVKNELMVKK